jgi:hypothetical protein
LAGSNKGDLNYDNGIPLVWEDMIWEV